MSSTTVAKAAQVAQRVMPVHKVSFLKSLFSHHQRPIPPLSHASPLHQLTAIQKQTMQSTGIWERIRRALAVAPERSNGVPLKHFRNPPPDPTTPSLSKTPSPSQQATSPTTHTGSATPGVRTLSCRSSRRGMWSVS